MVQGWNLNTRIPEAKSGSKLRGGGKVAAPVLDYEYKLDLPDNAIVRQVAAGNDELAVLSRQADKDVVTILQDGSEARAIALEGHFDRLLWGEQAGWLALDQDGTLLSGKQDLAAF
jgi:elongator complex protein 1